ncbi:NAD-dependent epimerase/dehydratase [mine drainage metagenome]|uniref:NAD-dependent epimerase/dehydratase n=1 Tax=mine drainage metagenome TaxID=410659 RepID=T1AAY9_9ZZZZ
MAGPKRVLLLGGGGGVVGSGVLEELLREYSVVSYHRTPLAGESGRVTFVPGDLRELPERPELFRQLHAVVNVVWYREPGPDRRFAPAAEALHRVLQRCVEEGVERFVQISLPPGPPALEARLPYFTRRRPFEAALLASGLKVNLLQPSAVFAPQDRLVQVMLGLLRRHRYFPLFGNGEYHLSPIWHRDLGLLVVEALSGRLPPVTLAGGPERMTYRELLGLLSRAVGRDLRLVRVSPRAGRWAVRGFNALGWHVLYTYEYDWLLSDTLGFPAPTGLPRPFLHLEEFLRGKGDAPATEGWDRRATGLGTVPGD